MIFYNNYEFCLFVFVWSFQQITCLWHLWLMVTERPGIYWFWPLRPYNIKGPLPLNKLVLFDFSLMLQSLTLRGWYGRGNYCEVRQWLMVVLGFRVLRASGVILLIGARSCDCGSLGVWWVTPGLFKTGGDSGSFLHPLLSDVSFWSTPLRFICCRWT